VQRRTFSVPLQMVQYFSQVHWYSGLSHCAQRTGPAGIAVSSKKTLPERGALRQEYVFIPATNVSKLKAVVNQKRRQRQVAEQLQDPTKFPQEVRPQASRRELPREKREP